MAAHTEAQVEKRLCKLVARCGGVAYKFVSPGRNGVPDRMCVFPKAVLCFVEVKKPDEEPTKQQNRVHKKLRKLGHSVYVVSTYGEVEALRYEPEFQGAAAWLKYQG